MTTSRNRAAIDGLVSCAMLAALSWAGSGSCLQAKPKAKIGLQLYSVRDECAKDLPGVLKAVGKMGYQGVKSPPSRVR